MLVPRRIHIAVPFLPVRAAADHMAETNAGRIEWHCLSLLVVVRGRDGKIGDKLIVATDAIT
jgi:hypothetical protein